MPKIVDHELQKEKVAEAAWRVIRKNGMEQASVRNIAEEAGLSVGSMRHYFSSQSELYMYSMKLVSERVNLRIKNIAFTGELLTDIPVLVQQILPLNEETIPEMEVWFAFVVKSMSDPSLAVLRKQVDDDMRQMFVMIIQALTDQNLALPDLDYDIEIERFYALIDGLAIHAVLRPEVLTKEKIESAVNRHLQSICRP
ncbi:transcriptional regulator, TetR family [Paenibacillus uliginis N3/975]|uniref:Transcriptional regulator, TetR family n=1 Tax=Paenibacillus uliginis N3/975 TaxID=1313296 RepID=A0A1X7HVD4_9BACL|nr:TetR/AcrR family transcriptional regulator [Paenibacillus uliginis]SMF92640.1 transcriptional regulator, TetR family [Paenibacillus uliginis N3/975]